MKRPAVLATPPLVPRPLVAVDGGVLVKLETTDSAELMTEEREEREELIPVGNEPVVDNEDGREDESGGNDPVKLEVAE